MKYTILAFLEVQYLASILGYDDNMLPVTGQTLICAILSSSFLVTPGRTWGAKSSRIFVPKSSPLRAALRFLTAS